MKRRVGLLRRIVRGLGWLLLGTFACALLLVLALRWIDPPTSAFMLGTRLAALATGDHGYSTHYRWVNLEHISPQAALAVIAAEDQQFPFHAGFDFKSIREAVRHNADGHHVHGASTISQQVAKNLFLWSGQSYFRKALEAGLTVLIERCWPKERILEVYLNIAEFGRGIYGVQAAAQHFFREDARRLDRADSALLAAVLPNPRRYRVEAPSRFVLTRRDWIAQQMAGLGGTAYLNRLDADAHHRP
ncbi:MAG TPA: monofunctional biosynthetic peptidoglycan transglycosylase [Steroidobacteraceae bacterium]|nr:monofunctional biosynthetic peptidoglycan transglycosylase [Steroidobacteraceae bacterium]